MVLRGETPLAISFFSIHRLNSAVVEFCLFEMSIVPFWSCSVLFMSSLINFVFSCGDPDFRFFTRSAHFGEPTSDVHFLAAETPISGWCKQFYRFPLLITSNTLLIFNWPHLNWASILVWPIYACIAVFCVKSLTKPWYLLRYKLHVLASDGKWEDYATVTVNVVNKNDEAPVFTVNEYYGSVTEELDGSPVFVLQVQTSR